MKNILYISKYHSAVRLLVIVLISVLLLPAGPVWAGLQPPLKNIPVPEPANLNQFLRTLPDGVTIDPAAREAAIALGKALFWDMQVGSDGQTACATCHFKAGADNRLTNTVHPGSDNIFSENSSSVPLGPNYTLNTQITTTQYDFPFFQISPPDGRVGVDTIPDIFGAITATVTRNFNDIVGSQGIPRTTFTGLSGTAQENGLSIADPVFDTLRQVTRRNAPSVINAVFNYTNFWDGRANNIFNGVNAFGPLDTSVDTGIWFFDNNNLVKQPIEIRNAGLASAAVGHALDPVVMSYDGRTFPELGKKMLGLTPLVTQVTSTADSVLGQFADPGGAGLSNANFYRDMIQTAFVPALWDSGGQTVPSLPATIGGVATTDDFFQIEANFSLFFGLSIQLYLSTLVSDNTPFDRFQLGNQNTIPLGSAAESGLQSFDSRCALCHAGSEFTTAVVGNNILNDVPVAFTDNTNHRLIQQRLTIQPVGFFQIPVTFDAAFHNTGVRATAEDIGRGSTAPLINPVNSEEFPLSFTELALLQVQNQLPVGFSTPQLPSIIPTTQPDVIQGSFKVPGLRNVELTAPYMHNGSMFTLDEVVEFYTRGGNFPDNQPEMAIAPIGNLRGNLGGRFEVVQFLKTLTDDRVRNEWAPFDHPQLMIPNGGETITLDATGGIPQVAPELTFNPIPAETIAATLLTSGTVTTAVQNTVVVSVSVDGQPAAPATVIGNAWSFTIPNLATTPVGTKTIAVTAMDVTGVEETITQPLLVLPAATITGAPVVASNQKSATLTVGGNGVEAYQFQLDNGGFSPDTLTATKIALTGLSEGFHAVSVIGKNTTLGLQQPVATPTTAFWLVDTIPPALTLNPLAAVGGPTLTIGGTTELGLIPRVRASTAATIGPVVLVSGAWSCTISGLGRGTTDLTITATDIATNVTTQTASVRIILPDGDFRERGAPDIADAVKALRIAVGTDIPTLEDMLHGDVAPLVNNIPASDGVVDATDALIILKKVVGLVNF